MAEIIPLHATLHYKCAFDIYPKAENDTPLIERVIRKIRSWCKENIKKDQLDSSYLLKPWFFRGSKPNDHVSIGEYQIRTASVSDSSNILSWFYEYIQPDSKEDARKWITEITLKSYPEGCVRFVTVIKHFIKPFHLGIIPGAPDASVPRFVDLLLSGFQCRREYTELQSSPKPINTNNADCVKSLFDDLRSQERRLPFIIVSKKRNGADYCIDPQKIAKRVRGNANVFCLETDATNNELNYYLDKKLSMSQGMVRVYYPKLDNRSIHRYFDERDFQRYSEEEILSFITNTFSRYVPLPPGSLISFQDHISESRRYKIQQLAKDHKEKQDEIELWEEENSQLANDKSGLEDSLKQIQNEKIEIEKQKNNLTDSNRDLNHQLQEMDKLRDENKKLRRFQEIHKHLDNIQTIVNPFFVFLKKYSLNESKFMTKYLNPSKIRILIQKKCGRCFMTFAQNCILCVFPKRKWEILSILLIANHILFSQ